eukprot:9122281-Ditylum_brightwellii.AAC.1
MEKEATDEVAVEKVWSFTNVPDYLTTSALSRLETCYKEVENYASLCLLFLQMQWIALISCDTCHEKAL